MDERRPRILVSVAVASRQADPALVLRRTALYADAVRRAGGEPLLIDASAGAEERAGAFATMDGLLLAGGADIDPARYGQPIDGSRDIEPDRDALEADAWAEAQARRVPVLGICRGFQAINVFCGGRLAQDVEGHEGPGWGVGPTRSHPVRLEPGTRLADLVTEGSDELLVNTFHHQAVPADGLAPGLVASAWSDDVVEGLEAPGERFVVGVQCHPERTDSTPASFERLFSAFVDAAGQRRGG
jgi:putative glutamine amidotransferase